MKKLILILCLFLITSCGAKEEKELIDYGNLAKDIANKGGKKVKVYVFAKEDCSICAKANEFFGALLEDAEYSNKFDYIYVPLYDADWNPSDLGLEALMLDVATYFQDEFDGTPYIVVGEKGFNGYREEWQDLFKKEINRCYKADKCNNPLKQKVNNEI